MNQGRPDTLFLLIRDAIAEAHTLVSMQIALFDAEVGSAIRQIARPLSLFLAAMLVVVAGFVTLMVAAVKGLGALMNSDLAAALVVGGAFATVALALLVLGYRWMAFSNLEPMRTRRQIGKDVGALRNL